MKKYISKVNSTSTEQVYFKQCDQSNITFGDERESKRSNFKNPTNYEKAYSLMDSVKKNDIRSKLFTPIK